MQRDRNQTRARILKAVGRLLVTSGLREVGINAIAREAGVDKVLIYRYFGGLPELLTAFAEETGFWPDLTELTGDPKSPATPAVLAERAKLLLLAFGRALRRRPDTQEILRWELVERNELTNALAHYREEQSDKFFREFDAVPGIDVRAIGSLVAAGQTYLALRAKACEVYNGIDLRSEEGWKRIDRAASFLVDAAFAKSIAGKAEPIRKRIAKPAKNKKAPAKPARKLKG